MWCVANCKGELIAHDIDDKYEADIICEAIQEKEPDMRWEVIEQ